MKKVLGIVNLHHNISLGHLTDNRSIGSTIVLGRYTFIDFVISNFTNSRINNIFILTKDNIRSLLHHLGFGQLNYNINLKTGGVDVLFNEKYSCTPLYNTDINNMLNNLRYIENSNTDEVIIAPAQMLMSIDFTTYIAKHRESQKDVSLIYKNIECGKTDFLNSFYLTLDNNLVKAITINKGLKNNIPIFTEITIIKRKKLIEIIKKSNSISMLYSFRDNINALVDSEEINAIEYDGYLRCFDSAEHYGKYSLELLNEEVNNTLFKGDWPIYTRTYDTPPTIYGKTSKVKHASIANGAIINGEVENSIIGREVIIEEGAVVKNSIILSNSLISSGSKLDKVIIDKNVRVEKKKEIEGAPTFVVIKQGEVV